jgi:hypothetical protein
MPGICRSKRETARSSLRRKVPARRDRDPIPEDTCARRIVNTPRPLKGGSRSDADLARSVRVALDATQKTRGKVLQFLESGGAAIRLHTGEELPTWRRSIFAYKAFPRHVVFSVV